jgi:hypothetical protein
MPVVRAGACVGTCWLVDVADCTAIPSASEPSDISEARLN